MSKWVERFVIAVVLVYFAVAVIGMYTTWRDCTDIGGMTMRGLFGLKCIKLNHPADPTTA